MNRFKKLMATTSFVLLTTILLAQEGLVAHWSFDTLTADGQFIDHVTGLSSGTVYGCQLIPGPVGNALEFDGFDDYVRIPADNKPPPAVLSSLTEGSISVWFRVENIPMNFGIRPIFYYGTEIACDFFDAANKGMIIEVGHSPIHNQSRRLYFTEWTNGCTYPSFCYDSWNPIIEGQWYHYVAVVGEDFNTGYLNGNVMTDRKYNFGNKNTHEFFSDAFSHEKLWIGRGYWDTNDMFFDGAIDEIKIFDHPLTQTEVDSLYWEGNPITTGLQDENGKTIIQIYPNPTREYVNIDVQHYYKFLVFKIFNSVGEVVYKSNISKSKTSLTINLKDLSKGIYVYTLESDNQVLQKDKLIIQ